MHAFRRAPSANLCLRAPCVSAHQLTQLEPAGQLPLPGEHSKQTLTCSKSITFCLTRTRSHDVFGRQKFVKIRSPIPTARAPRSGSVGHLVSFSCSLRDTFCNLDQP